MSHVPAVDPKEVAQQDPFKGLIAPALLNSADIDAYAKSLYPPLFTPYRGVPDGLKTATYEITFEGDIYLWRDEKSLKENLDASYEQTAFETKLEHHHLPSDGHFEIPPNSIVFVSPATYFRVPSFLALRFNLHIKLVHRGLLLGTGPLVDPGFAGRLLIPLHNLTSLPLVVTGSQGFIWVEVTKLSDVRPGTEGQIVSFKKEKNARTAKQYFQAASNLNPIVSTLHITSEKINSLYRRIKGYSLLGGFALAASAIGLGVGTWSLINDTHHYVTDARKASEDDMVLIKKDFLELRAELEGLKLELAKKERVLSGASKAKDEKTPK